MRPIREVNYSVNVFLPITNMCRNRCSYCYFRRDPDDGAWFMPPEKVIGMARLAKSAGCSEALLTLGERPEVHDEAKKELDRLGYESSVDYLEDLCRQILEVGLLPHTNAGLLSRRELNRLRRYNASMGLMLENIADLPAHALSPGKDPKLRLEVIENAGQLLIPFTTGLLIGIGETLEDRINSLMVLQEINARYGHVQEIIIQPFEPKQGTPMGSCSGPSESEFLAVISLARSIMPDINIQAPPNLLNHNGGPSKSERFNFEKSVASVIAAGVNDFGGISPLTPDFINPERPRPGTSELRAAIERAGFRPRERLPIYPRYAKDERFMSKEVKKVVIELADEEGYHAN